MVPPCSDRISRVPPYSRIVEDITRTGLSPTLARLSRRFRLIFDDHWPGPRSLATTSGVSVDVLSSGYLDVSVRRVRFASLWIQPAMTHKGRVSPFGDPRINGRSPLPAAYRSVLRPSSPLSAKASTKCPSTLDPTANPTRRDKPPDHSGRFAPTRHAAIGLLSTSSHSFTTAGQVGTQDPGATPCGATTSDLAPTERPPAAAQPIHNVQQPDGDPPDIPARHNRRQNPFLPPRIPIPSAHTPANGGAERDRTDDLLLAKQALSQLSYSPVQRSDARWQMSGEHSRPTSAIWHLPSDWWAREDLNLRPHADQARALTN